MMIRQVLMGVVAVCAMGVGVVTGDGKFAGVKEAVEKEYGGLEKLYMELHRHPELSFKEVETAKRLAAELRAAGFEVTEKVGGTGVVGVMKNGEGKMVLLRTELDALPVKEATGASYASEATGVDPSGKTVAVMHACGHDIHMTCVVGTARVMASMKDKWKGTLVVVGQPAEEMVQGAAAMLKDGLYARFGKPDYCLALHVDAGLESGEVGWVSGYAMANVDSLDVVIKGVGGHGAAPSQTKDPVVIAAQTVVALQTIASREVRPGEPVVVTVGSIHGGTKHNIIPDEVKLEMTVRTYQDATRDKVLAAIERIVKGTALAAGVPEGKEPVITRTAESAPAMYNDPEMVTRVTGAMREAMGKERVVERSPVMGAEDFGMFGKAEKIPVFMFRLGSVSVERMEKSKKGGAGALPSTHSSGYLPDRERAIRTGVEGECVGVMELLGR